MLLTRFFFLFAFLLFSASSVQAKSAANGFQCRAIHINDGDSFTCLTGNHKRIKVRLVGIDAPENGQAYGKQAKQQLAKLIHKQSVTLKIDGVDQYARRLATVYNAENQNINLLMVKRGYAWAYRFYKKDPQYQQAQQEAQLKKRALWQDSNPQEPYLWRKVRK